MKIRVEKSEAIFLLNPAGKKRHLWIIIDECGHTMIQIYSDKYPIELEKYFTNDKTNYTPRRSPSFGSLSGS